MVPLNIISGDVEKTMQKIKECHTKLYVLMRNNEEATNLNKKEEGGANSDNLICDSTNEDCVIEKTKIDLNGSLGKLEGDREADQ